MTRSVVSDRTGKFVLGVDRFAFSVAWHWLLYVNIVLGVLVLAPFGAPALMAVGATLPANVIYTFYSFLCHQLPERSYFLFGPRLSYSLAEIGYVWNYDDMLTLRQFIGNSDDGLESRVERSDGIAVRRLVDRRAALRAVAKTVAAALAGRLALPRRSADFCGRGFAHDQRRGDRAERHRFP